MRNNGAPRIYVYDGSDIAFDTDISGHVIDVYTTGANGLLSSRVVYPSTASSQFYSFDPSGSTSAVLDNAMSVGLWTAFDGFGSRTASAATTDASACYGAQRGYVYDPDIGLTFCTNRFYDSANARWLTRDPIGYRGGVNLYGYCQTTA